MRHGAREVDKAFCGASKNVVGVIERVTCKACLMIMKDRNVAETTDNPILAEMVIEEELNERKEMTARMNAMRWVGGVSVREIAKQTGWSVSTVYRRTKVRANELQK